MRGFLSVAVLATALFASAGLHAWASAPDSENGGAAEAEKPVSISKEQVLATIDMFRLQPVEAFKRGAVREIFLFAESSSDVLVEISPTYVDLDAMEQSGNKGVPPLLLGAFIAGNMEHQLRHDLLQDSPLEGVRMMLIVYRALLEGGYTKPIDKLEAWIALEKEDRLAEIASAADASEQ